jgi:hypothetical protein
LNVHLRNPAARLYTTPPAAFESPAKAANGSAWR